ncbi:MAG: exopolyphosphatase [Acidimicrobiales bacterium]
MIVAALDIGTQSTRLLVTDGASDLTRRAVVTRLGAGAAAAGRLADEAAERTLAQLGAYRTELEALGAVRVRAVATQAVRAAANGSEFLDAAEAALGVRPELISGAEEGALSFRGATAGLAAESGPFAVVDLGGGSCEFAVGAERCDAVFSAPFGSLSLTEEFFSAADPPSPAELVSCLSVVELHLDDAARELPLLAEAATFVGVAGTMCTLAAVEIGLAVYDRGVIDGFVLTKAAAEDVFRTLVTEPYEDRLANPGLPPERGRSILGGACAVVGLMRRFGLAQLTIRDSDLLDGIAAGLLESGG